MTNVMVKSGGTSLPLLAGIGYTPLVGADARIKTERSKGGAKHAVRATLQVVALFVLLWALIVV
jgi:hypothetical protein